MQIGADEAGKGPVLGPMVAAAVRAPSGAVPDAVDDSKRLAPARREELAARLRSDPAVDVGVAVVTPARIDDPETDMNSLTVAAQAEAIEAVAVDDDAVTVDAGDVDADRFGRRIGSGVDAAVTVRSEHRADENHPHVAAASIVAKVERDARIEALSDDYGDVGSGYPSDERTRTFLAEYVRDHGELPACARASWSTCADVLAAAEQSSLSEF
ncbi:ribonuclease HII [Haloplanus aerogenes]|uniref:Ribonuclease HII n=1 Tax=Haloplanus aerogenes TaxID=660522 RepID=A0A3G8QSK7_9EURY|nr:ribonuclease HII [Haloplanus aerogenes]AZH24419.1 ribonuclease HII [Haloplanus aerogenes]RMB23938.1 RNase HII [Haloplanus aerogenes]